MAIIVYETADTSNPYSQDGAMTNPLRLALNGKNGDTVEQRAYIRNNNALYSYTGIEIEPVDSTGRNIVAGVDGYGIKLKAGATQPTQSEWDTISYGDSVSMGDLTNTSTFLPFWIRIDIPAGAEVESFEDVVFRVSATETLIS